MTDGFYPCGDEIAEEEFLFEQVHKDECLGQPCLKIKDFLFANSKGNSEKEFLMVCCPAYNESYHELEKTIGSLISNLDFIKNTKFATDSLGTFLDGKFQSMIPVIVPIFDGASKMDSSMRVWIDENFEDITEDLEPLPAEQKPGSVSVRIKCSKWTYKCGGNGEGNNLRASFATSRNSVSGRQSALRSESNTDDPSSHFFICPIVKRANSRKHNSHHWFFEGICAALGDSAKYAFLTDCGTSYTQNCLGLLCKELLMRDDLIGVTARQRVELPNIYFHPCKESIFPCLRSEHSIEKGDIEPCWGCWISFFLSPAPLQGYEFEGSLLITSAVFNLVEALPVMPGPCQLLDYQKVRKHDVVKHYFSLLFEKDKETKKDQIRKSRKSALNDSEDSGMSATKATLTFTEFVRVNMRLAEDRVLSFVSIFKTGKGTRWVPGSTFFYQPECKFQSLLTQRRRWINGTFASFLYFFSSDRAKAMVISGYFDRKNVRFVGILWALQLIQLILVILSPSVFGVTAYFCFEDVLIHYNLPSDEITWATSVFLECYLVVYATWCFYSFSVPNGKIPELLSIFVAFIGFVTILPVYISYFIHFDDALHILIVIYFLFPVLLSLAQSLTCGMLYMLYCPWFLYLVVFFLVFTPGYSFARIWDTTWGNRDTGMDDGLNAANEQAMKNYNLIFLTVIVAVNCGLPFGLVQVLTGNSVYIYLAVIFFPMLIQMIGSFTYLFIVAPLRSLCGIKIATETNNLPVSAGWTAGVSTSPTPLPTPSPPTSGGTDGEAGRLGGDTEMLKYTKSPLQQEPIDDTGNFGVSMIGRPP